MMKVKTYGIGTIFVLFLISLGFLIAIVVGADQLCRFDINRRLPFYPNADIVFQEKDLVRYRAAGTSTMIFHSDDDLETVANWYRELNLEQIEKGIFRGLADLNRSYKADPDGGTTITYWTSCGT